jgi:hypothetical protein
MFAMFHGARTLMLPNFRKFAMFRMFAKFWMFQKFRKFGKFRMFAKARAAARAGADPPEVRPQPASQFHSCA